MEKALRERVVTDPALAVLGGRLYPTRVPENVPAPCGCYLTTEGPVTPCQGALIHRDTVEFRFLSPDKAQAVQLGDACAARLDRWNGTLLGQTIEGVHLAGAPSDEFNEDSNEYIRVVRVNVIYQT